MLYTTTMYLQMMSTDNLLIVWATSQYCPAITVEVSSARSLEGIKWTQSTHVKSIAAMNAAVNIVDKLWATL